MILLLAQNTARKSIFTGSLSTTLCLMTEEACHAISTSLKASAMGYVMMPWVLHQTREAAFAKGLCTFTPFHEQMQDSKTCQAPLVCPTPSHSITTRLILIAW